MINTIPGGEFEHADDSTMHGNPGFSRTPFEAPSPTPRGGGVGGCIHYQEMSPGGPSTLDIITARVIEDEGIQEKN